MVALPAPRTQSAAELAAAFGACPAPVFADPVERSLLALRAMIGGAYEKAEPTLRIRLGFYMARHNVTVEDIREVCRALSNPERHTSMTWGEDFLGPFAALIVRERDARRKREERAAELEQAEADRVAWEADRPEREKLYPLSQTPTEESTDGQDETTRRQSRQEAQRRNEEFARQAQTRKV